MKAIRCFGALFAACLLIVSIPSFARAQTRTVALQVSPTSVTLAPGEQSSVLFTVANPFPTALQNLRLTAPENPNVQINISSAQLDTLSPQASHAWTVQITRTTNSPDGATATVRLDYTFQSDGGLATPGIAVTTIAVQARAPETIDKIAQARVETAIDQVQANSPGAVYLIVTNISNAPIVITQVTLSHSDSISIQEPPARAQGVVVPPQESATLTYVVRAQDTVQPGKDILLFNIQVEWQKQGRTWHSTLHASTTFNVGVLGESALLTVFSVPSFLLLPGVLMVVAFGFLRKRLSSKTALLDVKDPEFWLVTVLLSFAAAYVYPIVTGFVLGSSRNYLSAYGLRDIFLVWVGSLCVGIIAWALWGAAERFWAWWRKKQYIPAPEDSVTKALEKLARRRGASLALEHVSAEIGGRTQNALIIERDATAKTAWVVPIARYTWKPNAKPEFRDAFDRVLERADNPGRMAMLIEEARQKKNGWLAIDWDRTRGALEGPRLVTESQLKPIPGPPRRLIEEK